MNSRLPILAGLMAVFALVAARYALPQPSTRVSARSSISASSNRGDHAPTDRDSSPGPPLAHNDSESVSTTQGQQLIADAAQKVFRYESLYAQMRMRIRLFGQNLVGRGVYYQLGPNEDKLLRMDLQIPIGARRTRLQQICDGRFLWIQQDLPSLENVEALETVLSRVDLYHVREAVKASPDTETSSMVPNAFIRCGLGHLLYQLDASFHFFETRTAVISKIPMWIVRGRWKGSQLTNVLPAQKDKLLAGFPYSTSDLPLHLPDEVLVTLGRHDAVPYRVQFLRQSEQTGGHRGTNDFDSVADLVVSMELFEVAIGDLIDPRLFQYKPNDLEVDDRTDQYLRRLGLFGVR